jgi:hypothetical protein
MSGMLRPGHNPLHWCRIALIAVALAVAGASAVAQQPSSPPSILPPVASSQAPAPKPAAADLDSFKTELDDIARSYRDEAQTEDSLAALR